MTNTDNFEGGVAVLAADSTPDFDSEAPHEISGVAIPANTIVNGGQNVDHFFPEEVLKDAVGLLEGAPIVKNFHDIEGQASADNVIGQVTSDGFQKGVGLVFNGEITDQDIAEKIAHGFLDVSPSPARSLGEFDESMGAQAVDRLVDFRDLAVVANGQPGAEVDIGPNPAVEALSMDALSNIDTEPKQDTLGEHQIHEPEFDSADDREWSKPSLNDFTEDSWDDLSNEVKNSIASHYIGSKSGFPPENFGDLFLPVVDEDGTLVLNALQNAKARIGQVEGLPDNDEERAVDIINRLANENFDASFGDEETDTESTHDEMDTQSDDGTYGVWSQSSVAADNSKETMTDLSDKEMEVLRAAEDIEAPADVLKSFAATDNPEIVESDTLSEKDEKIAELSEVFRDALSERTGLAAETVEAMPVDALCNEFRNDEGELEVETLAQEPETEQVNTENGGEGEGPVDIDSLSYDEREELKTKRRKIKALEGRTPNRVEELKAEVADTLGHDSYEDAEVDAL